MKFWDTSAILTLLTGQTGSLELSSIFQDDNHMVIWWSTYIEFVSGICRLHRETLIDENAFTTLLEAIEKLTSEADQIEPTNHVRKIAAHILHLHPLRAADALQLASALVWTDNKPNGEEFICLDKRLREAAELEGFKVLP